MECSSPQVVDTKYALCDEAGAFVWLSNYQARCNWANIHSNQDIQDRAACYSAAVTNCPAEADPPIWSKPGENYSSSLCWNIATTIEHGIESINFAKVTGRTRYSEGSDRCVRPGGLPYRLVAIRERILGCNEGWSRHDLPDGSYQCRRPAPPPLRADLHPPSCRQQDGLFAGQPILPATGEKLRHEVDLADTGSHPLVFARTYRSNSLGLEQSAHLGSLWTHNHAAILRHVPGTPGTDGAFVNSEGDAPASVLPATVTLLLPERVRVFTQRPGEARWDPGLGRDVLERAADGSWTYRSIVDESVRRFDPNGRLVAHTQRSGWSTTYSYDPAGRLVTVT